MSEISQGSYYRARYYDPNAGRFLSEDEIGNEEGANLYLYVGSSPIDLRDPTGFYKLKGFPVNLQNEMNSAINQAVQKLGETCPSCAGPKAPQIIHALETTTYVYKPDSTDCGVAFPIPFFRHIDVSGLAFNVRSCCTLASTLTHEASHLAGIGDKGPGNAYEIEKACFNCGTGEEPPKAPKGK